MNRILALLLVVFVAVQPASAQLFNGLSDFSPRDPQIRLFAATCVSDTSDATTYNPASFQSVSITGVAANTPVLVVVGVIAEDALSNFGVSSMTIEGVAATEIADEDGSGTINSAFYRSAGVIIGADSVNVSVTMSEAVTGMTICVWAIQGLGRTTHFTFVVDDDTASGALVLTMTPQSGGVVLGVCANTGVADSTTWANLSEVEDTQNAEFDYSNASTTTPSSSSTAITCDWTGGNDATGAAVAFH